MVEQPRARKKFRLQLIIAAVVLLIVVFAFVLLRSQKPQPSTQQESQQQTPPLARQLVPQPKAPAGRGGIEGQTASGPVTKGSVAQRANPDVSPAASDTIRGRINVLVRLQVDAGGNVSNASFDSEGPSKYFARAAMQAAQQWKFTPATVDGRPAASAWVLQFQFTREGADVIPTEETP
jgi:TonB family protein